MTVSTTGAANATKPANANATSATARTRRKPSTGSARSRPHRTGYLRDVRDRCHTSAPAAENPGVPRETAFTSAATIARMALDWTAAQALLDALPGVAYVVDLDGRIAACGAARWRTFAEANGARELADPQTVLGRELAEFIEGEGARQADACIRVTLRRSGLDQVAYDFRCDSPDRVRRMRMHISLLRDGGKPSGFLYQSLLLSEKQRPLVALFAPRLPGLFDEESPIITACSYCKRLRHEESGRWLSPEEYAEAGGRGDARISHGICGDCYEGVSAEFFGGTKER